MKFIELKLHPKILAGVEDLGFTECTDIQSVAIPLLLGGKDVAGLSQTGTGKTAAYVLPLMERVLRSVELKNPHGTHHNEANIEITDIEKANDEKTSSGEINSEKFNSGESENDDQQLGQTLMEPEIAVDDAEGGNDLTKRAFEAWKPGNFCLVLVPTRELAEQVRENIKVLGGHAGMSSVAIYGGMSYEPQKKALNRGVNFVIATPGRLIDLYKEHVVDLNQVRAVVFDEADRMFDMGFKDDMKYILKRIPKDRQFIVFSATLNFEVMNVAYEFGSNPIELNISKDQTKAENVTDEVFHVGEEDKPQYLLSLLQKYQPQQAIVFSNFKHQVERIADFLTRNGVHAMGISSLLTQAQRNRVMEQFKDTQSKHNILIATDVAARGLDVKGVDLVINYELPDDPENYVHRIGRTGRAGAKGLAFSLSGHHDVEALGRIENYLGHKVVIGWLDDSDITSEFKSMERERRREPKPFSPRENREGRFKSGAEGGRESHKRNAGRGRAQGAGQDQTSGRRPSNDKYRERSATGELKNNEQLRTSNGQSQRSGKGHDSYESGRGPKETSHRDRKTGRHKPRERKSGDHKLAEHKLGERVKGSSNILSETTPKSSNLQKPSSKRRASSSRKTYTHRPAGERFHPDSNPLRTPKGGGATEGVGSKVASFFKKLFS